MAAEPTIDALFMKLRVRDALDPDAERKMRDAVGEIRDFPTQHTVVHEGDTLDTSILLIEGLMCRYKDLPNGARQICELNVAGDFVDLHGLTLKTLDHNILTLTPCTAALVPHEKLVEITESDPHLTRMLWFNTNLDAAIHREWVLSLGRRSALARLAHLFCELQVRLEIVGLADGHGYQLGLTQLQLAECLGLTSVHVNRTLQELRGSGAVEYRGGRVTIHDFDKLKNIAGFDDGYLSLERRPR